MKLFWKQFITMMCFIVVSFMIFGNIMVHTAFQTTINRETDQSIEEMKIFQYALIASLDGLPKDYQATDMAVAEIVKSIQQSLNNARDEVIIYNKSNKIIYQNSSYQGSLIKTKREKTAAVWQIHKQKEHYYIESLCSVQSNVGNYILEIHRNIDHVYQDRNYHYETYLLALSIVSVIFAIVLLLFSMHFTFPIRKLSQAVRAFAKGNYQSRVKVRGNDEVSVLSRDFNQMANQLEENIEELKEAARRQEEFTAAFSHELKTPLTSIIGYADMLRSVDMTQEDIFMSADYIFKQGKRLERLALKMMELTYVDKQEITFQKIDVDSFLSLLRVMTEKLLESSEITFSFQSESGHFYGDMDLLLSLFSNLIDNARKASEKGGQIFLEGKNTKGGYSFVIRDNGRGIPEEEIYKITEPFYMVDKSRARKEGGAGIGMSLCQKIILLHHAEWDIQSVIGEGTEIHIQFKEEFAREDDKNA